MKASLKVILILIIFTGFAFAIGYIAGWSKQNRPNAKAGAAESVAQSANQPLAAGEMPVGAAPEAPGLQQSSPAAGQRPEAPATPSVAPPTASVPTPRSTQAVNKATATRKPTISPAPTPARSTVSPSATPLRTPEKRENITAAGGDPIIFVKDATHDFGRAQEGDIVHDVFVFENRGKAPLLLRKVSTSCGCTAALVSSNLIAPGESGKVEVSLRTTGYKGKLTKEVYLDSNDPHNPHFVLKLVGEVKRDIDATPSYIDFGVIAPGATFVKTVRVASQTGVPFYITKLSASSPSVHLSEARKVAAGGYEFDVTVGPVPEARRVSSNIVIEIDSTRQPKLVMVLFGEIRPLKEGAGK